MTATHDVPRTRTYEQIKAGCLIARRSSDQNDWTIGDLSAELLDLGRSLQQEMSRNKSFSPSGDEKDLADRDERALLERLADDIGMAKKSVVIRCRISQRVTKSGPLAWIRNSTLTYATMRELYAIEKDEDLDRIARKAVAQNLTVREVRSEMEAYRDARGVESGIYICKTCSEPIKHVENMVGISKSGQARAVFCGWACAGAYVETKAKEDGVVLSREPAASAESAQGEMDDPFAEDELVAGFEGGIPMLAGDL